MPKKILVRVRFEIEQVDRLLDSYTNLLDEVRTDSPNLIEVTALASVLHSFYNGLESIFITIAKEYYGEVPKGGQWHRDLLLQMAKGTADCKAVISQETLSSLIEYLAFRHFYRHSYSFYLDWEEMEQLVFKIHSVWDIVKLDIWSFIEDTSQV